jgi:hypothetical protein
MTTKKQSNPDNFIQSGESQFFENGLSVKLLSECISEVNPDWFMTAKSGKDQLIFKKGDKVVTTGKGVMKAGISLVVKDSYLVNGIANYYAGGLWHKQSDLVKA